MVNDEDSKGAKRPDIIGIDTFMGLGYICLLSYESGQPGGSFERL